MADSSGPTRVDLSPPSGIGRIRPALLRTLNDEVTLRLILENGALSRSDIVRLTGVSKPTGSQIMARLEEAGLVIPVGVTAGRPGRSAQLYRINPESGFAAAIDVTSHQISARVADITGTVLGEHTSTIPTTARSDGPGHALSILDRALAMAGRSRPDLSCVVVGATGSYDADADCLRYAAHLNGWDSPGLVRSLEANLGVPVFVENDVNLAAVAERRLGAAKAIPDFFLFWVGDGIGGAVFLGDRLHRGFTGGAGEIAYVHTPGAGIVRNPVRGGSGAFEQWVGGADLADLAERFGLEPGDPVVLIGDAVSSDDPAAAAFLDELSMRYALVLAAVIAVLDPRAIVLAGSVLGAGGDVLRTMISRHLDTVAITNPGLLSTEVPTTPVLAGALCMALDHAREQAFVGA